MPPLYRMPVFYAFALIASAAIAIGTWSGLANSGHESASGGRIETSEKQTPGRPRAATPQPPAPTDGILRTSDGLRRKVLIKDLDVVCQAEPAGGKVSGSPLDYFAIRYVYG